MLLIVFSVHDCFQTIYNCIFKVEGGKILAVVADFHSRRNGHAMRRPGSKRFQKRTLANSVGSRKQQMLVFAERDIHFSHYGFMVMHAGHQRYMHELAGQILLYGNRERPDRFIFFSHIHHFLFKLGGFLAHARRDQTHLPAFFCKFV